MLPVDLVPMLQNFLLTFVINSACSESPCSTIDKYVQRQILQTIAVFYKRTKLDSFSTKLTVGQKPKETSNIVQNIIETFKTANIKLVFKIKFKFFLLNLFS